MQLGQTSCESWVAGAKFFELGTADGERVDIGRSPHARRTGPIRREQSALTQDTPRAEFFACAFGCLYSNRALQNEVETSARLPALDEHLASANLGRVTDLVKSP